MFSTAVSLEKNTNQARGIARYAIDFLNERFKGEIDPSIFQKVQLFHTDSVICGISALALQTNAPTILQKEALAYPQVGGACVFGKKTRCATEKAIVANCSAVREWDSNGTIFGYNEKLHSHQAGEFGHNDFYPVVVAAAQTNPTINGRKALRAMICLDEIRGRLAEVFSLKTYKIDHVVYGAIASAAVYGALLGATEEQIESAIGMTVAHYIPWRAIRAGKQLSDSKGASAALSTEVAILSMKRAMNGFEGPKDIFRNPEAIFRWNIPVEDGNSPFNLFLSFAGKDFAVDGMHFKLGLYEHQSAAAIEGLISLIKQYPVILSQWESIQKILITSYEPAFGIIGDPAKRNPSNRQSADHSMVYIVSTVLRKAIKSANILNTSMDSLWCQLMLSPYDYSKEAIVNPQTRKLMDKVEFEHGGPQFDKLYPDGIPTTVDITLSSGEKFSSGLIMYPSGHCRNTTANLTTILDYKFRLLGKMALEEKVCEAFINKLQHLSEATSNDMQTIYDCSGIFIHDSIDK